MCWVLDEEFEDTKEVIRICISKKNRQHNGQKKKYKRTNNDQQNTHIKLENEEHNCFDGMVLFGFFISLSLMFA